MNLVHQKKLDYGVQLLLEIVMRFHKPTLRVVPRAREMKIAYGIL